MLYAGLVALLLTSAAMAVQAQTAGTTTVGVSVTELNNVINGWSVREQLLGQSVYNDKGEKIGKIEDIILTKDRLASYGIVSTGGFLAWVRTTLRRLLASFSSTKIASCCLTQRKTNYAPCHPSNTHANSASVYY